MPSPDLVVGDSHGNLVRQNHTLTWLKLQLHEGAVDLNAHVHESDRPFREFGHLRLNRSRHFARVTASPRVIDINN